MAKLILLLFMLPLACCSKDKDMPPKQAKEKPEQTEAEDALSKSILETQNFVCEEEDIASCETPTGIPWHEIYSQDESRLEELEAEYEAAFKKPAPQCRKCEECGFRERSSKIEICLDGLKYAICVDTPYPMMEEKIAEDEKYKIAYKKRFGVSMTDFEQSIVGVYFGNGLEGRGVDFFDRLEYCSPKFSVARTATGAYARSYKRETKLNTGEWLDFIRALRNCTSKWKTSYFREPSGADCSGFNCSYGDDGTWLFVIYYLDEHGYIDRFKANGSTFLYPQNWMVFRNAANNIEAKIKKRGKIAEGRRIEKGTEREN